MSDDFVQPVAAKKPWQSKTVWLAAVNAGLAFWPQAREWVATHPEGYMIGLSVVFAALRKVTHGKVDIV